MRLLQPYSKYLPGVLLILLFVFVLLVFRSFHNTLLASGVNATPAWGIVFMILIAFIGIIFYLLILNGSNRSKVLKKEIELLVRRLEDTKVQKESKKETVVKEKIDIEKEAKAIIPSNNDNTEKFGEALLQNCARRLQIVQGLLYLKNPADGVFSFKSGYAFFSESEPITYIEGETLAGQVAKNKIVLNLSKVPDNYIAIMSGLGEGSPSHLLIIPIISANNETIGIIELASFKSFSSEVEELFAYIGQKLGEKLTQTSKT
ncbi:MAG: GAF domain-containing protein [Bacteroidales bacterium]|nr:MAG: GAF domain-containing protein [Bacteroidales bacterium]